MPRPLLYAHRGAAAEFPENTLPSFQRGLDLGADALEMDVHMTRDGHIVVSHDPSVLRMTGVNVPIAATTLADLQRWDAGYGFVNAAGERPHLGKGIYIPTLEEVVTTFPTTRLNVDLKQRTPPIVEPVIELLRRLRATARVTLASFHTRTMIAVRGLGYDGPTAVSRGEALTLWTMPERSWHMFWKSFGRIPSAVQIPTRVGGMRTDKTRFLRKCHDLGMRVDYWTINDPDQARRLLALGADGIMTDDPAAIQPVFAEHLASSR